MPKQTNKRKGRFQSNIQDLQNAAKLIKQGVSQRRTEQLTGTPRGVLRRFMDKGPEGLAVGRRPVFGREAEEELVNCVLARAEMGFPCTRKELLNLVQEYVVRNNLSTPFNNAMPGKEWYGGFMRRHRELSLKKPEALQKVRVKARDPFVVYSFYDQLKKVYDEVLPPARLIYNTDESAFGMDPRSIKFLGCRGQLLNHVTGGSGRENTTVLACVSATGQTLPPLIVFTAKAVQPSWLAKTPFPGIMYSANDNGWMTESTFFMWFRDLFIPHVNTNRSDHSETAVLLMDGHSSHISLRIIEKANEENIKLIKFPSHLTDKIQPLDVSVFSPIKKAWNDALVEHGRQMMGRSDLRLQKSTFADLLSKVWFEVKPSNTVNGFRCTGFDKAMVKDSWFTAEALNRYRSHHKNQIPNHPPPPTLSNPELEFHRMEVGNDDIPLDLSMPREARQVEEKTGFNEFCQNIFRQHRSKHIICPYRRTLK